MSEGRKGSPGGKQANMQSIACGHTGSGSGNPCVLVCFTTTVKNTKRNLRTRGFIWLNTCQITLHHQGKSRQGPKERKLQVEPEAEKGGIMIDLLLWFIWLPFLRNQRLPAQKWHHPPWTGTSMLIINPKKGPQTCLQANLIEVFSPRRFILLS